MMVISFNSVEQECVGRKYHKCANGTCVPHYLNCHSTSEVPCPFYNSYWCKATKQCVKSDEDCLRPCNFKQSYSSQPYNVKCKGFPGKCAEYSSQCPPDCPSQLKPCPLDGLCINFLVVCTPCSEPFYKRCRSDGRCYKPMKRCDGTPDCSDRSDELNCPKKPAIEAWMIGTVVFSLFVLLVVVATYMSYGKKRYQMRQQRRERERLAAAANMSRPLMGVPRPDRVTSHLGEEARMNSMTMSVEPPFVNLYSGPRTHQFPTHMTMDFSGNESLPPYRDRVANSTHDARPSLRLPSDHDVDNERDAPPPSYYEATAGDDQPAVTDNDGLPTYEETVRTEFERRIKDQESEV